MCASHLWSLLINVLAGCLRAQWSAHPGVSRGVPPRALAGRSAPPYVVQLPVPAFAVSRTWITGLIRQLPNAPHFKHAPVAASTHDLRSIRAGRVRCGAQRQESGADEVPGDAREGARRGMGRCRAGPLAGTHAETAGRRLRRRRAMAFPARLTRCLRRRRARRLRRCRGSLCGETPAEASVVAKTPEMATPFAPGKAPLGLVSLFLSLDAEFLEHGIPEYDSIDHQGVFGSSAVIVDFAMYFSPRVLLNVTQ